MSTGLLRQLEAYYESVEERQTAISMNEITGHVERIQQVDLRPETTEPSVPRIWIAIAVAAVILLIIGGLSALLRTDGDVEPIEEPSPTTTTMPTTPTTVEATQVAPRPDTATRNLINDFLRAYNSSDDGALDSEWNHRQRV